MDEKDLEEVIAGAQAHAEAEHAEAGEEDPQGEGSDDGAAEGDEGAEEPKGASAGEDDDEAFLESQQGKPVPLQAFQKKYKKWKERNSASESRALKAEAALAELQKNGQLGGEDKARLQRLMTVFGHFDQAAKSNPWLAQHLMELGQGKATDWRALHQALGKHLEAAPKIDPLLAQQLEQQGAQIREMQTASLAREFEAHVTRENAEIATLLGGEDDGLMDTLNAWAEKLAPEDGGIADLPDRVGMAKALLAWADKRTQRTLKKQTPTKPRAGMGLEAGKGRAAAADPNGGGKAPRLADDVEGFLAHVLNSAGIQQ